MSCEHINLGNGNFAIVCGTRRRMPRCKFCSRISSKQCDFEVSPGKTCDVYMCADCAEKLGPDRDHCPNHRILPRMIVDWPAEWRDLFEERAGVMEFAGNLPKAKAEEQAEIDTRNTAARQLTQEVAHS